MLNLSCFLVKRKNGESKNLPCPPREDPDAGGNDVLEGFGKKTQSKFLLSSE
jgi:hypothetical protein